MAILVMDTATEVLAVGIGHCASPEAENDAAGADVISDILSAAVVPRAHSRWLQPTIAHGMKVCRVGMENVTVIGVGVGPGSYTGVRIAVSTAKALALALEIPLAPVPTLLTLAEATCPDPQQPAVVLSLLNARRQRAFGAIYRRQAGRWVAEVPMQVRSLEDWWLLWQRRLDGDGQLGHAATVVHDFPELPVAFAPAAEQPAWTPARMHNLAGQLPAAMLRLVASGAIRRVAGEDIHAVVPEYALMVEAESRLAERRGQTGDSN